jgi:hypothetical protein
MATTKTTLVNAAKKLTAVERATLALRAKRSNAPYDHDADTVVRPREPEVTSILQALDDGMNHIQHVLGYIVEWLYQAEIQLGWLECLDTMMEREQLLAEALAPTWTIEEATSPRIACKAKQAFILPFPQPFRGLERDLPIVWWAKDAVREPPASTAEGLRDRLAENVRSCLDEYWFIHLGLHSVLSEMAAVFNEESVASERVAELMEIVDAQLLAMHEGLALRTEPFELPALDEQRLVLIRNWVNWDQLKGERTSGNRAPNSWVPATLTEKFAELEARLAAELRAEKRKS